MFFLTLFLARVDWQGAAVITLTDGEDGQLEFAERCYIVQGKSIRLWRDISGYMYLMWKVTGKRK